MARTQVAEGKARGEPTGLWKVGFSVGGVILHACLEPLNSTPSLANTEKLAAGIRPHPLVRAVPRLGGPQKLPPMLKEEENCSARLHPEPKPCPSGNRACELHNQTPPGTVHHIQTLHNTCFLGGCAAKLTTGHKHFHLCLGLVSGQC